MRPPAIDPSDAPILPKHFVIHSPSPDCVSTMLSETAEPDLIERPPRYVLHEKRKQRWKAARHCIPFRNATRTGKFTATRLTIGTSILPGEMLRDERVGCTLLIVACRGSGAHREQDSETARRHPVRYQHTNQLEIK